jgi:pSer/pThr/pTyr-binding forkhead associated (FHA) protein
MSDSLSPARLMIITGPDAGKSIELPISELVIGRKEPAGLIINHPEISRRHARIYLQNENYFIADLGSSNGTSVNGVPVVTPRQLSSGDMIQLGPDVRLSFTLTAHAQTRPGAQPSGELQSPNRTILDANILSGAVEASAASTPPRLIVTVAGHEAEGHTLNRNRITLGRAEDNDIVVPSPIISRHHATLELTPAGYEVRIEPGATNTLTCQGRPVVDRRLLANGDVLRIDSETPGMMVSMTFLAPGQAPTRLSAVQFGEKERLTFGRDPANDVVFNMPSVSRFHAQVTKVGRR